jgi:hypothetical protein
MRLTNPGPARIARRLLVLRFEGRSFDLSPGQMAEIDRVCRVYPHLQNDNFVQEHLDEWLS